MKNHDRAVFRTDGVHAQVCLCNDDIWLEMDRFSPMVPDPFRHGLQRARSLVVRSACAHVVLLLVGILLAVSQGFAAEKTAAELADMSLEELMNQSVTSVSKKEERVFEAPAAIFVITDEEIRRSGLESIPEILRLAPGLDVARITANQWGVSSRGFNGLYANKLLVLMDGRSVYSPVFSGVHWDSQDTLIEDIDRIEVIRGPGATLWGANAVNGVINIITKSAKNTQGTLLMGGAASHMPGFGGVRYGGKINEETFYRVYAKYFDHDDFLTASGHRAHDGWDMVRTGFRLDWDPNTQNTVTWQGDFYSGRVSNPYASNQLNLAEIDIVKNDLLGANTLGRWTHRLSDASEFEVQMYYDLVKRPENGAGDQQIDTFDIDANHRFALGNRNEVIWGVGYRHIEDQGLRFSIVRFEPPGDSQNVFSMFLQDEVTLVEKRLALTLGSKLEHNDYTGWELQPGARLLFTPHEEHTIWASAARAARTPARFERDIRGTVGTDPASSVRINIEGNRHFDSETLDAFELGYRVQPVRHLSFDIAGFYNIYDHLRSGESGQPTVVVGPPARIEVPIQIQNRGSAETYGVELASHWRATDWWRLTASYTWLNMQVHFHNSTDPTMPEGENPRHQAQLRSSLDLPGHVQFDAAAYYVDSLSSYGLGSHVRLDLRVSWQPVPHLDLSVGAQNLLDNQHPEFGRTIGVGTSEVPRTYYGKFTWRF